VDGGHGVVDARGFVLADRAFLVDQEDGGVGDE
jgi:hypothetical protein